MKTVQLRHLSGAPIVNGLGLPGAHSEPTWPRYVRTTDIATPTSLREDVFASQPPEIARNAPLLKRDIVMTAAGSIGKSTMYMSDDPACFAGFLARFRANDRTDARFVLHWMQSKHYWDQIVTGAVKSTIENFSAARYRSLQVPLHSLVDQRRIADFLDDRVSRIDRIIAARRAQYALLDDHLQAIPDSVLSTANWQTAARFGYAITRIEQGWSPQCHSEPAEPGEWGVLKVSAIRPGLYRQHENKSLPPSLQPQRQYEVNPGDLLISRANTPPRVGIFCCAPPDCEPRRIFSDKIMRVQLGDSVLPQFASLVGQTRRIRGALSGAGTGTSGSMVNIRAEDIRSLPMPRISVADQERVVHEWTARAYAVRTTQDALTRSIELLTEYKQSLITAAVTGQLDVTTASTRIPE